MRAAAAHITRGGIIIKPRAGGKNKSYVRKVHTKRAKELARERKKSLSECAGNGRTEKLSIAPPEEMTGLISTGAIEDLRRHRTEILGQSQKNGLVKKNSPCIIKQRTTSKEDGGMNSGEGNKVPKKKSKTRAQWNQKK